VVYISAAPFYFALRDHRSLGGGLSVVVYIWRSWCYFFLGINAPLATLQSSEPNTCGHGLRWLKDAMYRDAMDGAV
jgi:hypothetical protein